MPHDLRPTKINVTTPISGFEREMRLRPEVWEATLESDDEEVRASVPMILALHEIDVGTSQLDDAAINHLDEVAPDLIPNMVLTLNKWVKARASGTSSGAPSAGPFPRQKVAPNDPCPCGSERKFKKCFGAVTFH